MSRPKGIPMSEEAKLKISKYQLGRKRSIETRRNISAALKGKKAPKRKYWLGKKREDIRGDKHWAWKGGVTSMTIKIRASLEYKIWRRAVFERDNWTCVWCRTGGAVLQADHIKPFSLFPELRFALDNGRTLCKDCHKKTDTYGERAKHYKLENN